MSDLNLVLALIGGLTLVVSLGSGLLKSQGYLPSETMLAFLVGIAVGPHGLDAIRLADWGPPLVLLEEFARLTVALAVMSIALRLPESYFRQRVRSMAVLLGPGLLLMWLLSSLVTGWILGTSLWMAALVGAIVTPTDPVLASSIAVGKTAEENIPERLRHLLSAEAGANDGGAYLFVFFALFMLQGTESLLQWTLDIAAWAVGGAIALGLVVGAVVGRIERLFTAKGLLEETSRFTITVALTFAVLGTLKLLGTDDVLAVFVAGLAYNWQARSRDEAQEQKVEEVFNRIFTLPVFVFFGAALPWADWLELGWPAIAFVVGILLLRRLPMVFALRPGIEPLDRQAAALFVGWFGPIGVAAIFYATLAVHELGMERPWILASLVVTGSILAHGVTATLFTLKYGEIGDTLEGW